MKPVDLNNICAYLGVRAISYQAGAETIRRAHLEQMASKNPFICCISNGIPIIFFDGSRSGFAVRFHVATALGYFALGYLTEHGLGTLTLLEKLKADLFAVQLLLRIAKINRHFPAGTVWAEKDYHARTRNEGKCFPRPARL